MYKGIVISNNSVVRNECERIITDVGGIELTFLEQLENLSDIENDYNFLFILINDFSRMTPTKIKELNNIYPTTNLIFYHHSLLIGQIKNLETLTDIQLIIGDQRQKNLAIIIRQLIDTHWRRLPLAQLKIRESELSPRIRRAIRFIEINKLDACTLTRIASYLGLSPGYFGQEFKRETGYSFRGFIQRALVYYEENVFLKLNLSAIKMAKLLGYSELSSFSRSFKKRRGVSPLQFLKTHE